MSISIIVALLLAAAGGAALAQTATSIPPLQVNQGGGFEALSSYLRQRPASDGAAEMLLEQAYAGRVPRSASNAALIRGLLARRLTSRERIVVLRLVRQQWSFDDATGRNSQLLSDLRAGCRDADPAVRSAALLAYTRTGYQPDALDLLESAAAAGVIDADTRFGEVAHMIPFAPAMEQVRLASILQSSGNGFAADVIGMSANSAQLVASLDPQARALLVRFLRANEPGFGPAVGRIDFGQAANYSMWLASVANLTATALKADVIWSELNRPELDPRKIMAFLASANGEEFIRTGRSSREFATLLARASSYASQHPQNADMREMVEHARSLVSRLPG